MKVSINLAQEYSNVDLKAIPHDVLLKRIGSQLGAVEESIEYAPKYDGVVVVKIVSSIQHPNADRLRVCMVDDGRKVKGVKRDSKGHVQVVCGAPNARAGIFVAWLPPGSTVPSSFGEAEPFVLEVRELRGVVSNGMLASAKELGISDDHEGILEILASDIRREPKPGEPFGSFFHLDDFIIDCENKMFTHRPDCFGNLGVARELAGISGLKFKSPSWYLEQPKFKTKSEFKLAVKNTVPALVPRFMAVTLTGVHVHSSPIWMQALLNRVGIKPINNVVDVTNYISWLTGQPLHAYDADKLAKLGKALSLEARMSKKGEKLNLLNGKTLTFEDDKDIVIASHGTAVGLGGIMGGSDTEVDLHTRSIVLECATFDMYTIRRSSMRHGLFTDASTRYTKGQSPLQNDRAVAYAMQLLEQYAHAGQASSVVDMHETLEHPAKVIVGATFINERLGSSLSAKDIKNLLELVEFDAATTGKDKIEVRPPFWRTDIELPEDIVEEVGRLHGFDALPQVLPPRSAKAAVKNRTLDLKSHIRFSLKEAGANEVVTYSFVHGDLMLKCGQDPDQAYHLRNAISPDLQYYRLSILPSLLEKVQANIRADYVRSEDNEFAIFEIGKGHIKGAYTEENVPEEFETVALVFTADDKTAKRKYEGAAYYQARAFLEKLVPVGLVFEVIDHTPKESIAVAALAPFDTSRAAYVKLRGKLIGFVGELSAPVAKALKLPAYTAAFEIDITALHDTRGVSYEPISTFPKTQQDITLEVGEKATFSSLQSAAENVLQIAKSEHGYNFVLMPHGIFQAPDSDKKRVTFRIWLSHPGRTLRTEEVNSLLQVLAAELKQKHQAERI